MHARLDVAEVVDGAGEGPVLGRQVEVAEAEGDAHRVEAQQLRAVHLRAHMHACDQARASIKRKGICASRPAALRSSACCVRRNVRPTHKSMTTPGSCTYWHRSHPLEHLPQRQASPAQCTDFATTLLCCMQYSHALVQPSEMTPASPAQGKGQSGDGMRTTVAKSERCVVRPAQRPPMKVVPSSKPFHVKACVPYHHKTLIRACAKRLRTVFCVLA